MDSIPFPKLEYGDSTTEKPAQPVDIKLQGFSSKRNNSLNRNDSFDLFGLGSKTSQPFLIPNLPSFNSSILTIWNIVNFQLAFQLSLANANNNSVVNPNNGGNNQPAPQSESQPSKGRNFLNGVLTNTLNSDTGILSLNELLGIENNFSVYVQNLNCQTYHFLVLDGKIDW